TGQSKHKQESDKRVQSRRACFARGSRQVTARCAVQQNIGSILAADVRASWDGFRKRKRKETLPTSRCQAGINVSPLDRGVLMAADATTGKALWSFQTNAQWKASPMTYLFDQQQCVAVA